MSLLRCGRGDCSAVMCDRYSHEHGYICNTCFNELVERGPGTDVAAFMRERVHTKRPNSYQWADAVFPFPSNNSHNSVVKGA